MPGKKADTLLKIGLVIMTVLLVSVIARAVRGPHVTVAGDAAPDFTVITERGTRLSLVKLRNRVVVLNFWASWCLPCIEETPSLNAFQSELQKSGVVVVGISIDKDERAYRKFLRDFRVDFETALDPGREISSRYGTFQIPESYIIGKNGVVAAKIISNRNWMDPEILNAVRTLL